MLITNIKTFLVNLEVKKTKECPELKNLLFVKLETDEGIYGWGECYTQPDREKAIEMIAKNLGNYIVGRNPFHIKHFSMIAYNDFACKRGSMEFYCALSGIEQACWDIVGKYLETPVYNLLGGPCRNKVRVYANGWDNWYSEDPLPERAIQLVKQGFTALKFDPFDGPWRMHISLSQEKKAIENVRKIREAVGPDIDLLIECHRRLAPVNAIRIAKQIEVYEPFWYEEPVSSRNIDKLAEVCCQTNIPIVTGEDLYTKLDFQEVFNKNAAQILNPDVCNCGGILELKEIAAIAEANYIAVSPHNYNSTTVALAATIQVSAVIPNFIITEYFVNFASVCNRIVVKPLEIEDGYIKLPVEPGLGIELDEEALLAFPYKDVPKRSFRYYNNEII